ncbi:MAG: class I SAM-dependent methyltransferase [Nitrososphaerota archaeon]
MKRFDYLLTKWLYGSELVVRLVKKLDMPKGSKVLNLGCGPGKISEYLVKKMGIRVVAGDVFEEVLDIAKKRALKDGWISHVDFILIDRANPYFGFEEYDGLVCETITSFLDPSRAVKAYFKALKPDRRLCALELAWYKRPSRGIEEEIKAKFGPDVKILSDKEWRSLFQEAGLRLETGEVRRLSLTKKALDDLRYDIIGSFLDMAKTFGIVIKSPEARKATKDFLLIYKEYSNHLGLAEYVYSKR